jgi:hypothetical protein
MGPRAHKASRSGTSVSPRERTPSADSATRGRLTTPDRVAGLTDGGAHVAYWLAPRDGKDALRSEGYAEDDGVIPREHCPTEKHVRPVVTVGSAANCVRS